MMLGPNYFWLSQKPKNLVRPGNMRKCPYPFPIKIKISTKKPGTKVGSKEVQIPYSEFMFLFCAANRTLMKNCENI